ncbi:MAG TPA: Fic family protein [Solirubrobacteraceae bacterium]|nr:Fic family protein [Solirubrobacteraceae bacterium]
MLFATPPIKPKLQGRIDELDELRARLRHDAALASALPWMGRLRRQVRATSVESSTSIEGFSVSPEAAQALVGGSDQADPADESQLAVACYARAMDHVGVMAVDPAFRWLEQVILDLHFDACHFQPDKGPGRWRDGPISVTAPEGGLAYRGPDSEQVPELMAQAVAWLEQGDLDAPVVVRGAMAHLHVVSIHPFRDGNGRIARIVQSLLLAREGLLAPELGSIEEYLGQHTPAYYASLRDVQGGSYKPERDATDWVSFCVKAHVRQARQRLVQIEQAAARWSLLEKLVAQRGWPDRLVIALEQSLTGGSDRASYCVEAGVAAPTATNDFRRLLDAGLISQRGRTRNTRYYASARLSEQVARETA